MPADFAEYAEKMGRDALSERYKAGRNTIDRWRKELGVTGRLGVPEKPPADFAERARTTGRKTLMRHYNVGLRVIDRWRNELGLPLFIESRLRPLPEDFAEIASSMTKADLLRHYNADANIVSRWLAETGVIPAKFNPSTDAARQARQSKRLSAQTWRAADCRDLRLRDMFDDAADVIRRERFAVYRCGPTGKYLEKGLHWRVGNTVMTPDQLLERADRYRRRAA